jgi:hypothetical protein
MNAASDFTGLNGTEFLFRVRLQSTSVIFSDKNIIASAAGDPDKRVLFYADEAPTLTLAGGPTKDHVGSTAFTDPGVVAFDQEDTGATSQTVVPTDNTNTDVQYLGSSTGGFVKRDIYDNSSPAVLTTDQTNAVFSSAAIGDVFTLHYKYTDSSGQTSATVSRTVTIVDGSGPATNGDWFSGYNTTFSNNRLVVLTVTPALYTLVQNGTINIQTALYLNQDSPTQYFADASQINLSGGYFQDIAANEGYIYINFNTTADATTLKDQLSQAGNAGNFSVNYTP